MTRSLSWRRMHFSFTQFVLPGKHNNIDPLKLTYKVNERSDLWQYFVIGTSMVANVNLIFHACTGTWKLRLYLLLVWQMYPNVGLKQETSSKMQSLVLITAHSCPSTSVPG